MKGHIRNRDRRKDGGRKGNVRRWQLIVDDVRDESGERRQRYRPFSGSKADAERALRAFIDEIETGFASNGSTLTVGAYVERWLGHVAGRVRPRTLESYRQLIGLHILPTLGRHSLAGLRPLHVQDLYQRLLVNGNRRVAGGGLSANSVLHVHRVLFSALKQAVRWRLIPSNIADAVEPPRLQRTEMRTLDSSEVVQLVSKAKGTRLYEVILLAVSTGMRRGEVLGLRWMDVDFERASIRVRGSLQRDGSLGEPKTSRSRREVGIPASVVQALRSYRAAQSELKLQMGGSYVDRGLVFADEFGKPWKADGISTLFGGIARRAGVAPLRFHDLRHTAASLLLDRGLPITTVAATLGHANTSTTLSVYAHAIKGGERAAAGIMEDVLQGDEPGSPNSPSRGPGGFRGGPNEGHSRSVTDEATEKAQ